MKRIYLSTVEELLEIIDFTGKWWIKTIECMILLKLNPSAMRRIWQEKIETKRKKGLSSDDY